MKKSFKIIITFLLLSIVSFSSILYWLNTNQGQNYIKQIITNLIAEKINLDTKIDNINISLTSGLTIQNITIYKNHYHIADINEILIKPRISIFMLWQIHIPQIIIDEVNLIEIPQIKIAPDKKTANNYNISPFLPNIKISSFVINKLILPTDFTQQSEKLILNIKSKISLYTHRMSIKFKLTSKVISGPALLEDLTLEATGQYKLATKQLLLNERLSSKILYIDSSTSYNAQDNTLNNNLQYELDNLDWLNKFNHISFYSTKGTATITGSINNLSINILGNLFLDTNPNAAQTIEYNLVLKPQDSWQGNIKLSSDTLFAEGQLDYIANIIKLENFVVTGTDLRSEVSLEYNLNNNLLSGEISYQDDSLAEIAKYFNNINSGTLYFKSVFSNHEHNQTFKLKGQITNLSTKFGFIDNILLDIYSPSLLEKKFSKLDILLQYFRFKDFLIKEISLNAKSINKNLELMTNIASHDSCLMTINTKGVIDFTEGTKITIPLIDGKLGSVPIKLTKPINITLSDIFYFNMEQLKIGDGTIKLYAQTNGETINSKLDLRNIATELCEKFLVDNFKNNLLNGHASLEGKLASPILTTNFEIAKKSVQSKLIKITINSITEKQKTLIDIKLNKAQKNIGSGTIELANNFSLSPVKFELLRDKPFIASIKIDEKLDIFELLPRSLEHKILGNIYGSLDINGTIDKPNFDVDLKFTNGQYKYKKFNIKLNNISFNISSVPEQLLFGDIKAYDGLGNRLNGQGFINFATKNFEFKFNTKNLNAINNLYMQGALSGNMNYAGNKDQSMITGNLTFGPMKITIPDKFSEDIPELNIVNDITEPQNKTIDRYPINLDITLNTTDTVFVSGRGVNSRLEGTLNVTGQVQQPLIDGNLRAVEGKFKEFGRVLDIEKSTLVFQGPINPSPYLNIIGTTIIDDIELRVMLTGSITNPILDINSSPALSQEKALSVLLFGNDTPSPFQALQLANSARKLTGGGHNSFDPLDFSKKMLFIDDLSFKADQANPTSYSVQAGKYLSDQIYLEIQHGGVDKLTKTRLEIQLTPKISLENINNYQEDNSIGIKWKMEY
ncbi:MAG: translocation/assembly module TamB domain-containing protein [Rickettsiaceae bacterium]|nr:translocation/assembly module TamB domain-containing protein [Rickettsiaceae bacterium]